MSVQRESLSSGVPGAASDVTPVPFVSVIVPVYNDLDRVKTCVAALERQTYPPDRFEVVVVDNGSRESVADSLVGSPHVRVIREERTGSYAARNAGLRSATGEVLAFTDADCIPTPEWLERGVAALKAIPGCGLVAGRVDVFVADPTAPTPTEVYELAVGFPQERCVARGRYGATANVLTSRAVVNRVGDFDEDLFSGGDRAWGNAVFDAGYRVEYCAEAVILHPARRSIGEMRRKMRRVAFGNHLQAHLERPIGRRSLLLRLLAPPVRHLADIWTSSIVVRPGERLRASLVALFTKYVWSGYRIYFAFGGRADDERVRGDLADTDGPATHERQTLPPREPPSRNRSIPSAPSGNAAGPSTAGGKSAAGVDTATRPRASASGSHGRTVSSAAPRGSSRSAPSRPRRLLYVSPRFPCVSLVFEQNEILGLIRAGMDVRVLACRVATAAECAAIHPFARPILEWVVYPSTADSLRGFVRGLARRRLALARIMVWLAAAARNPLAFPKAVGAFALALGWYRRLSDEDYGWVHADFVQNSATAAFFLAELLGVPFSFKVHAFDIFDRSLRFRDPLRTLKMRHARTIFSEHDYGRRLLTRLHPQIGPEVVVHYTAVRTDEFLPLPTAERSRRFVALGRLVPKKGFDVLVRATERLRQRGIPIIVEVYGDGPESGRLRDLIRESAVEDSLHLRGRYENGQLPDILRTSAAVVVPSVVTPTGDMDGIPTVIYEAMALGRPVIASAISGIPEVVQDGVTGLLVPPGDAERLADAMAALLTEVDAARFGAAARRRIQQNHDYVAAARSMIGSMTTAGDEGTVQAGVSPAHAGAT